MSFHIFHLDEVYSNADGTVQYIEFHGEANGQNLWAGHSIVATSFGNTHTYIVPANLPSPATLNKAVLVATQGYEALRLSLPAGTLPAADYVVPDNFLFINNGVINFPGMDSISYNALPTDNTLSLNANLTTGTNSPTNFAGATGKIVLGSANTIPGTDDPDLLAGTADDDTMNGLAGSDTLSGGEGNDKINGGEGSDALFGELGNDTLNGGAGDDSMTGGAGNDTYVVDSATDVVSELADEGNDTLHINRTVSLVDGPGGQFANIENAVLTGATAINATGNVGNNALTGNAGANVLLGAGGNDTLVGGAGADTLNGGPGDDAMTGGDGNDTYAVDSTTDTVTETNALAAGGSADRVSSEVNFSLADAGFVENLTLTGTALDGTGNTLSNVILGNGQANTLTGLEGNDTLTGNDGEDTLDGGAGTDMLTGGAGNDSLDGGTGRDTLTGGLGDDTYAVDGAGAATYDMVTEAAGAGSGADTIRFAGSGTYVLGANMEKLDLLDAAGNANGTGNALANTLTGNSGSNVLDGKGGSDTSTGGDGADAFVFSTAPAAANVDTLADFLSGTDTLRFDNAVFTALGANGPLSADAFNSGAGFTAGQDSSDRLIYDTTTGNLYYDANGSGPGASVQVAVLSNAPGLVAADIQVI